MASTYFNLHVSGFEVESHLEPQMFYDGSENLHPVLFQRSVTVRRNRYLPHLNSSSLKQQQHRFHFSASLPSSDRNERERGRDRERENRNERDRERERETERENRNERERERSDLKG